MSTIHNTLIGTELHYSKIKTGSGSPNVGSLALAANAWVGDIYVDLDTRTPYVRKGLTGVNDWVPTPIQHIGNHPMIFTTTGATSLTLPTSGTLLSDSGLGSIPYNILSLTGQIKDSDLAGFIQVSKLQTLTADRAVITDGSGYLAASTISTTKLGYLSDVTSNIQAQINAKQPSANYFTVLTGDVTTLFTPTPGIFTATITNDAVTTPKIQDGAVTAAKISGPIPNEKTTATSANTPNTIVARDASGNVTVSTATGRVLALAGTTNVGESFIEMTGQTVAPATPSSGKGRLYSGEGAGGLHYKRPSGADSSLDFSAVTGSKEFSYPDVTGQVIVGSATQTMANKTFSDAITLDQITTPMSPSDGKVKIYVKADNKLYRRNAAGTESLVAADGITSLVGNVTGSGTGAITTTISAGVVTSDMLQGNIALSKLATVSNSKIITSNASGVIGPSIYADTFLESLSGASSNIQTQLNAITATRILNLSGDVVATGNASGTVTATIVSAAITTSKLFGNIPDSKLANITSAGKVENTATTATPSNTTSAIVARDINGSFLANTGTFTNVVATDLNVSNTITQTLSIGTASVSNYTDISEVTAPVAPSWGRVRLYAKNDKKLYTKDSLGVETEVGAGAGAAGNVTVSDVGVTPASGSMNISSGTIANNLRLKGSNGFNADIDTVMLTASRSYGLPNVDGTFTINTATQTLLNKTLLSPFISDTDMLPTGSVINISSGGTTNNLRLLGSNTFRADISTSVLNAHRAFTLPNVSGTFVTTGDTGSVTSTMILDGTILNADINASAGIADTKLATIATAGKVADTALSSLVTLTTASQTLTNKTLSAPMLNGTFDTPSGSVINISSGNIANNLRLIGSNGIGSDISTSSLTTGRIFTLPNFTGTFTLNDATQTLTNKTINGSNSTLTNLPASQVLGRTDGANPAAGFIGQTIYASSTATNQSSGSNLTSTGITLSAGMWSISYYVRVEYIAPKVIAGFLANSVNGAALSSNITSIKTERRTIDTGNTTEGLESYSSNHIFNISSSTTYYPGMYITDPVSSAYTILYNIWATRIA